MHGIRTWVARTRYFTKLLPVVFPKISNNPTQHNFFQNFSAVLMVLMYNNVLIEILSLENSPFCLVNLNILRKSCPASDFTMKNTKKKKITYIHCLAKS